MKARAVAALAVVGWMLCVGGAAAFELERVDGDPCNHADQNIFWRPRGTAFSAESLSDVDAPIAREEAQAWNDATSFTFTEMAQAGSCNTSDGVVSMGFSDHLCDGTVFGEDVLAVTNYRFRLANGEFLSAEITFNSNATILSEEATFRHVALHELGHVTGLDHSDSCGQSGDDSVMKAVLRRNDPRFRVPGSDDIAGVQSIYGDDTPTPTTTPTPPPTSSPTPTATGPTPTPTTRRGGGGCSSSAPAGGDGAAAFALALATGVLVLRLRRPAEHLPRHSPRPRREDPS